MPLSVGQNKRLCIEYCIKGDILFITSSPNFRCLNRLFLNNVKVESFLKWNCTLCYQMHQKCWDIILKVFKYTVLSGLCNLSAGWSREIFTFVVQSLCPLFNVSTTCASFVFSPTVQGWKYVKGRENEKLHFLMQQFFTVKIWSKS